MTGTLPPDDDQGSGTPPEPGRRKDGQPYKDGNTRDDGSYGVGKYRPPESGKFQKNDGRKRGKRKKGSKNLAAIWAKKLTQKIKYEGKEQTAAEWLVEGMIRRGIARSDRAAETALGEAGRLEGERDRQLGKTDAEIIETWLAQRLSDTATDVSDDDDNSKDNEENDNADQ